MTDEPNDNPLRPFSPEINVVCDNLIQNFSNKMTERELEFVMSAQKQCSLTQLISLKQITWLGRLSLVYPQNGIFEHHNWWPEKSYS